MQSRSTKTAAKRSLNGSPSSSTGRASTTVASEQSLSDARTVISSGSSSDRLELLRAEITKREDELRGMRRALELLEAT